MSNSTDKKDYNQYLLDNRVSKLTARQYDSQVSMFLELVDMDLTRDDIVEKAIEFCNSRYERNEDGYLNKIDGVNRVYIRRFALLKLFLFNKLFEQYEEFKKETKGYKQADRSKLEKALSMEEFETLVENLDEDYSLIVSIMFFGALRISEVLSIHKDNVKLIGKMVRVTVLGKGKKVTSVFMPEGLTEKILKYKNNTNDLLFDIKYYTFRKYIKIYTQDILGKTSTSHEVGKHTRSEYEWNNDTPLLEVRDLLHHKSVNTTMKYRSTSGIDSKKAMKKRQKDFKWLK